MKKIFFLLLSFFSVYCAVAQLKPKVSLLTFATGTESHSIFGHTALRVQDKYNETDIVYNYGMFDFDTPNFLFKFSTGKLDYRIGIENYQDMLYSYFYSKRQVEEQVLNLNEEQTTKLINQLQEAYRPENRYYRYRFLNRNCSTELRDLLFNIEGVDYTLTETGNTYRTYLNRYARVVPWFKFGINLGLGSFVDKNISTQELMFLPDFLSEEVEKASLNGKPLAGDKKQVFSNLEPHISSSWKITPFMVFSLLFVVMVLGKSNFLIQAFSLSVGLGGLVILALMLFSEHPEVQYNYNLLWCNPLYLVSFGFYFTPYKEAKKILAIILTLCLLATLGIWISKTQGYDIAFFPILISLFWINMKIRQRFS